MGHAVPEGKIGLASRLQMWSSEWKWNEEAWYMAVNSAKSFLKILERSGLVADEPLKKALAELSKKFNGRMVKLDDLTSHLIEKDLITEWHREKLAAGRYKGFFLGKYRLLGHLGTGGMSSVYLATHKISGQKRAIKVLPREKVPDKSYLDRFYREGKAAASLNDNNIVRIYDICNEGDRHYMVMEYVEGKDLYELVKEVGPLPHREAASHVLQAAHGLAHAHDRNLVHRDIKPANLLLAHGGTLKILDLGLALFKETDEESLTVMHGERVMGTADYLSPEQAVDSHDIDLRADVYSLGCTLYYLLTGRPPFPTGSLAQRIARHRTEYPTPVQELRLDCPEPLVMICNRMMRKDPDHRFQNCPQLQVALQQYLDEGEVDLPDVPDDSELIRNRSASSGRKAGGQKASEFAIEPVSSKSPSSKSFRSSSSKSLEKNEQAQPSESSTKLLARRQLMPVWALMVIIVMGFAIVALVVLIARTLVAEESRMTGDARPALVYNQPCRETPVSPSLQFPPNHFPGRKT